MVYLVLGVNVGIWPLLLFCYFGKVATESYQQICDHLYDFKWYQLPNDVQMYFILMISNAQTPMYYSGIGMVIMNLETFTKVRHYWTTIVQLE